jgi:hypothetical protein
LVARFLQGEIGKKGGDLPFTHFGRMALSVVENKSFDRREILLLGARAVVLVTN